MTKDTIRNFLRNGATIKELIAECTTSTLRDWNPDGCKCGSAGYIVLAAPNLLGLHDEGSVSAYVAADGAIMIASNGGDTELAADLRYGVAELAALIDLRDQLEDEDQIDCINDIILGRGLEAVADYCDLEIVSSSELPNAELLDSDPTIRRYARFGVKDASGTVTVAYESTSGNTICTWGLIADESTIGNIVLEGFAGEDIEDLLAIKLL